MYDKYSLEEILRIVFESELQNKIHIDDIEFIDKPNLYNNHKPWRENSARRDLK